MKRKLSIILVVILLITSIFVSNTVVQASPKPGNSRAIAIVFDNSGSMYQSNNQAWCRATYAMEVFASMLNDGDKLVIYPMHPITVNNNEYTMEQPFVLTDASQASVIRDIYTGSAGGTPIESVDAAVKGIKELDADKKYVIILTDGDTFSQNGSTMNKNATRDALDARIQSSDVKNLTMMYLGIGEKSVMPNTSESESFVKIQAKNSKDVLAALTDMCNKIFGRDILPSNHISSNEMEFDISLSKLIVFVQGENIDSLNVTSSTGSVGTLINSSSTKYSEKGSNRGTAVDKSLQGMMVTYANCDAGNYSINYSGTATSIEVYYEPNADLDFVFTDGQGNQVDYTALYEGDYKISFGLKDAKTGKLIESDLLGNPKYTGSYSVNGKQTAITYNGYSGEVNVPLKIGDSFEAKLTVTYLSGYTITKDSSDFGWPQGGITISPRPAGELRLEISGGDQSYPLQDLEKGNSFQVKVFYQNEQLVGEELKNVELNLDQSKSNAQINKEFADDHYILSLHYKDPSQPAKTVCGQCTVPISATYTAPSSNPSETQSVLSYNIEDDFMQLEMEMKVPEEYILISDLEKTKEIVAKLTFNGEPLTPEQMDAVDFNVNTDGILYTVTKDSVNSQYRIKFLANEGISEGDYKLNVSAKYTDRIGRNTNTATEKSITLSNTPLWLKWLIVLLVLLIIIIITLIIMHIKVLPKYVKILKADSKFIVGGSNVTSVASFKCNITKKELKVTSVYGGKTVGISMNVKPGGDSYLRKPQTRRSAVVELDSIKKIGTAKVQTTSINGVKFEDDGTGGLKCKHADKLTLTNGAPVKISGTIMKAGTPKPFTIHTNLNFKK